MIDSRQKARSRLERHKLPFEQLWIRYWGHGGKTILGEIGSSYIKSKKSHGWICVSWDGSLMI